MRKVSAVMPVLIAGVVFSFVASFLLAQEDRPAHRSLGEGGTAGRRVEREASSVERNAENEESAAAETKNEVESKNDVPSPAPAVPEAPPANGKNDNAGGVVEITVASKTGVPPESVETEGVAGTSLITVAFDNVPVQDVVNMFAQISGANIIMAGSFTNLFITANLKNVEWKSALNLALGSVNLSMIEDPSGILMVVTSEMYPKKLQEIEATKQLVTRTIVPRYLNAVDLVEQIKLFKVPGTAKSCIMLSPRGSITTSQSANQDKVYLKSSGVAGAPQTQNPSITTAIIITDIREYVDKIVSLIQSLDKCEPQVFIEARIIDIGVSTGSKIGFDWEMLDKFGVTAGLTDLAWDYSDSHSVKNTKDNKLNQYDKRSNQDDINKRYDINGQQYEESSTTYEESPPGSGNWVSKTVITPTRTITDTIGQERNISDERSDSVLDSVMEARTAKAFMNVSQVSLFLSALQKDSNAEMLSHPVMIVGNRVEAKIHVGEQTWRISLQKTKDGTGQNIVENYSEDASPVDLGLKLWVIPEIDLMNDAIRLSIEPEMTVWVKDITTAQGSIYPVISTRRLTTRVNVPSGQTVVIGGLVDTKKAKIEKKVPILGDIPLLGLLFRHTTDTLEKRNLLIMLTPTILDDRKPLTGFEAIAQQMVDKMEKMPLSAVKAVPSNTVSGVTIGTNAGTPAAGMGRQASASNAPAATPGNAAAPLP